MLKSANIYGKIEFYLSAFTLLAALLLIIFVLYWGSASDSSEGIEVRKVAAMLLTLFFFPYFPLAMFAYSHALNSWNAGVLAIATSLLYGIICFLVASSVSFNVYFVPFFIIPFAIFGLAAKNQSIISEARRKTKNIEQPILTSEPSSH